MHGVLSVWCRCVELSVYMGRLLNGEFVWVDRQIEDLIGKQEKSL